MVASYTHVEVRGQVRGQVKVLGTSVISSSVVIKRLISERRSRAKVYISPFECKRVVGYRKHLPYVQSPSVRPKLDSRTSAKGEERHYVVGERLGDWAEDAEHLILVRTVGSVKEAREEHEVAEDEDAASVVVALRLDVGVCHEEDGEDDRDNVPTGEDEAEANMSAKLKKSICLYEEDIRERLRDRAHPLGRIPRRERDHRWDLEQTDL